MVVAIAWLWPWPKILNEESLARAGSAPPVATARVRPDTDRPTASIIEMTQIKSPFNQLLTGQIIFRPIIDWTDMKPTNKQTSLIGKL